MRHIEQNSCVKFRPLINEEKESQNIAYIFINATVGTTCDVDKIGYQEIFTTKGQTKIYTTVQLDKSDHTSVINHRQLCWMGFMGLPCVSVCPSDRQTGMKSCFKYINSTLKISTLVLIQQLWLNFVEIMEFNSD